MKMKTQAFTIILNTPAFLGNAEQKGGWRTPPIKALLREWWRIAAARDAIYRHAVLREQEGVLFGNAWLEPPADKKSRFCQSKVRLALAHWNEGKPGWEHNDLTVNHPEVKFAVGSQLYLGYGPLAYEKGAGLKLKRNAALQAGGENTLKIAWPDEEDQIPKVLQLIDWFGTFGGRSRNGWGSLSLGLEPLTESHPTLQTVLHPLADCLKLDWPHAIGQDKQGVLIWESKETFADWKEAMRFLAKTKIGFRTQKAIEFGQVPTPHRQPLGRHILAYPVTNHRVTERGWGGDGRLANQLRFKLFRDTENQLRARIYHTPHACPLPAGQINQLAVWQKIHGWLDQQAPLTRLGA